MAETKDQDTPTADDIVDDLAEEMGVDDESASDLEDAEVEEEEIDDEKDVEEDRKMDGLDGVFDVAKGKKKKKKKKKKKRKKKNKKSATEAKPDLFNPSGADDDIDLDDLGLDDLDDPSAQGSGVNKVLVGIIIALVIAMGGLAHFLTVDEDGEGGIFGDLILLAKGEYHDEMERRREAEEEEFRQAQIDALPRFGTLYISGRPQGALIRLNGEIPHGKTPTGGQWRELRMNAIIENLSIDETHHVEISHAGHETFEFTIEEDHWEPDGADYRFDLSANLHTEDNEAYEEFQARMSLDDEGPDERIRGTVRFDTEPEGAVVKINSLFVRDEDGNKLTTPFEVDEYYAYDLDYEELDEEGILETIVDDPEVLETANFDIETPGSLGINEYKIEDQDIDLDFAEQTITVDTPPGRGNSIQIMYPRGTSEHEEYPVYATMLQRSMWDCEWKDDDERQRLGDNAHIQEHCDYAFDFDVDFPELMAYIERREEERRRIEEQQEQLIEDEDLGFDAEDFERDLGPDDPE